MNELFIHTTFGQINGEYGQMESMDKWKRTFFREFGWTAEYNLGFRT